MVSTSTVPLPDIVLQYRHDFCAAALGASASDSAALTSSLVVDLDPYMRVHDVKNKHKLLLFEERQQYRECTSSH